jgi:hypothetical protein
VLGDVLLNVAAVVVQVGVHHVDLRDAPPWDERARVPVHALPLTGVAQGMPTDPEAQSAVVYRGCLVGLCSPWSIKL